MSTRPPSSASGSVDRQVLAELAQDSVTVGIPDDDGHCTAGRGCVNGDSTAAAELLRKLRDSPEDVQQACIRSVAVLLPFKNFIEAIKNKTFANHTMLQDRLHGALKILDDAQRYYSEHDLHLLCVAELLVLSCVKPQMDRVAEQFTPSLTALFEPTVSLEEYLKRVEPYLPWVRDVLKKKILFWRERECNVLIDHLRSLSCLVSHSNLAMATLKSVVREQIRHEDIPIVLRDLYYAEKFARAILVQRIIELQMMIGGTTATSWLSTSHAPDIRERKEVERRTLSFLRKRLRNKSVQTDAEPASCASPSLDLDGDGEATAAAAAAGSAASSSASAAAASEDGACRPAQKQKLDPLLAPPGSHQPSARPDRVPFDVPAADTTPVSALNAIQGQPLLVPQPQRVPVLFATHRPALAVRSSLRVDTFRSV